LSWLNDNGVILTENNIFVLILYYLIFHTIFVFVLFDTELSQQNGR